MYVGGWVGVGACPAGVGSPAGSGGGRLGRFQFRYYSPDLIPDLVIQLRPADFTYTNFSRGGALDFIY